MEEFLKKLFNSDNKLSLLLLEAKDLADQNDDKELSSYIDKEINDLAYTPSVFTIIKNDDKTVLGMTVDKDHNKIVIKLPEQDFYNYKSLREQAFIQPVLNSLVIIPALTYVLEEVAKRDTNDRYEYSSYAWYRAVKKVLSEKYKCNIDSEELSNRDMLDTAQKLINVPLAEALQTLSSGYGNTNEDEEE